MRLAEPRIHPGDLPIDRLTGGLPGVLHGLFCLGLSLGLGSTLCGFPMQPCRFHCIGFGFQLSKIVAWRRGWVRYGDLQLCLLA
jgi:hypothetical protein